MVSDMDAGITYAAAGVDIDKADRFVDAIKELAKQTPRTGVMGDIGGFGGLYSLNTSHMERPVLVSSTDGVGTKLKIAFMLDKHDTIGIDLVAMCVNDIAVQGARPLFFLDYFATGALHTDTAVQVIKGIVEGCKQAGCALIGGETAEMPGMYQPGEYDLAGFAVGIVDNKKIIDGSEIRMGHKLIGLASTGLHSNGFSLVRKICFDVLKLDINTHIPELGKTLGQELLTPTKIYQDIIQGLTRDLAVHGLAHITGGGLAHNILRIIPKACKVLLKKGSWDVPPIFTFLREAGKISEKEMIKTFNNGIGMVVCAPEPAAQDIMERLGAMQVNAFLIGEITERKGSEERLQWI
jgi:phosphoribosylformylglycinamidine cyclo-ligase